MVQTEEQGSVFQTIVSDVQSMGFRVSEIAMVASGRAVAQRIKVTDGITG